MTTYYSNELAGDSTGLNSAPSNEVRPYANVYGGKLKRYRATITMASQASGSVFVLANIPTGEQFAFGVINTDTSTGTATVEIGNSGNASAYAAAAAHTTTNSPTLFGNVSNSDGSGYSSPEQVLLTTGTAALPASGTLEVDIYTSAV